MLTKNKNNKHLILFKCKKDKILFYDDYYDNYFLGFCPICKEYIWYFCSFYHKGNRYDIFCCLRRLINVRFFIYGPKYTKRNDLCNCLSIWLLIPDFSVILILMYIVIIISDRVTIEKAKKKPKIRKSKSLRKTSFCFNGNFNAICVIKLFFYSKYIFHFNYYFNFYSSKIYSDKILSWGFWCKKT